jgi:RNA polymerase sigma-70 factor (ECF subfamily)
MPRIAVIGVMVGSDNDEQSSTEPQHCDGGRGNAWVFYEVMFYNQVRGTDILHDRYFLVGFRRSSPSFRVIEMSETKLQGSSEADTYLVERIREGDPDAWQLLIDRYEGRLLAYTDSRIRNRATSEDIVQEAFVGFLTSLPNYDGSRPLESYLFSICAYKLTDHLRREGRRPSLQMHHRDSSGAGQFEPAGHERVASSIARSVERKQIEEVAIRDAIAEQIERWKSGDGWTKLMVIELIFVRGLPNKEVANLLNLTEQQVANYKSDFQIRLRSIIGRMNLDPAVFPELED